MTMKVLVLGGDGFCGWPASLHLSARGDDVVIVDNLLPPAHRPLFGVSRSPDPLDGGAPGRTAGEISGREIGSSNSISPEDHPALLALINESVGRDRALRRAAGRPTRWQSGKRKRYTIDNNVNATHNVLCAIVESGEDIHTEVLGTMGVYLAMAPPAWPSPRATWTSRCNPDGGVIETGILYDQSGSIYHMTKVLDRTCCSPTTPRTTNCGSPTCTRASSGAPTPSRPRWTNG